MMLTIDDIAARYNISRASATIRTAAFNDFGGRYDEATVKRIMEPEEDEPEEDIDEVYRWLHDDVGF